VTRRPARWYAAAALAASVCASTAAGAVAVLAAEIVIYGFEAGAEGWVIPDWAKQSKDYVVEKLDVAKGRAAQGEGALELTASFPGGRWTGAYVEREVETIDWTPFGQLSVDVLVPEDAPQGLKGQIILTVGDTWQWTEMNRSVALLPGQWTTIAVNLKPGSMDWKFFPDDAFRRSVRKIGVRVESNEEPVYAGSLLIDNIRLAE
jgi:hypothetical protein